MKRETVEVAQARIPSPEIVKRDADAHVAQFRQRRPGRLGILEQHRLGYFDLEPVGGQTGHREGLLDHCADAAAAELDGRKVYGDTDIRRPFGAFSASATKDLTADLNDNA